MSPQILIKLRMNQAETNKHPPADELLLIIWAQKMGSSSLACGFRYTKRSCALLLLIKAQTHQLLC